MKPKLIFSVFFVASAICSAALAQTSQDKIWNTRANACVKLLNAQDPALRNTWRGHCDTTEVDELISNTVTPADQTSEFKELFDQPRAATPAQTADCGTPPQKPVAETQACGLGSRTFSQNMSGAAELQVKLPGNKCISFVPILLTNKTDFACNAVQSRIACVDASYDQANDRTTITFSTIRRGTPTSTTIAIDSKAMAKTDGHIDDLIQHPQFAMLPAKSITKNGIKDVIETIKAAVAKNQQQCTDTVGNSVQSCTSQAVTYADRVLQEQLRHYRDPGRLMTKEDSQKDAAAIVADMKAYYGTGRIENWLLFLALAANEVGLSVSDNGSVSTYDPIYTLSDAVNDNSGLSFGTQQIDIAANSGADVQMFWNIIAAYNAKNPSDILKQAITMQNCLELPLRLMTVRALQATYQVVPNIDVALRSADGIATYDLSLKNYLDSETTKIAALSGFFRKSMVTQILYADRENQYGKPDRVLQLVEQYAAGDDDLSDCAVVTQVENKILAAMIWNDPDNHSKGNTTYHTRYETVRETVRKGAPNAGRMDCH